MPEASRMKLLRNSYSNFTCNRCRLCCVACGYKKTCCTNWKEWFRVAPEKFPRVAQGHSSYSEKITFHHRWIFVRWKERQLCKTQKRKEKICLERGENGELPIDVCHNQNWFLECTLLNPEGALLQPNCLRQNHIWELIKVLNAVKFNIQQLSFAYTVKMDTQFPSTSIACMDVKSGPLCSQNCWTIIRRCKDDNDKCD